MDEHRWLWATSLDFLRLLTPVLYPAPTPTLSSNSSRTPWSIMTGRPMPGASPASPAQWIEQWRRNDAIERIAKAFLSPPPSAISWPAIWINVPGLMLSLTSGNHGGLDPLLFDDDVVDGRKVVPINLLRENVQETFCLGR